MKQRPLSTAGLNRVVCSVRDPFVRTLIGKAQAVDQVSKSRRSPLLPDAIRAQFLDCGTPVPSLLVVFEQHDAIECTFDEEADHMLEVTPEPNFLLYFNGACIDEIRTAFDTLTTVCRALKLAAELIAALPRS